MPKKTKMVDEALVKDAREALELLGSNAIISIRLRAIIASYTHEIKKVADIFDINRATLHGWIKTFKDGGVDLMSNAKKPSRSKLKEEHQAFIKETVEKNSKVTVKQLRLDIEQKFSLICSKSAVHRMLDRLGFSHITGRKRHYKSSESAKADFKKKSKRGGTEVT
jgi:transposase